MANMNNSLETVIKTLSPLLESRGFSIKFSERHIDGMLVDSCNLTMDSSKYVGGICYWPESTFEFQFNSCESGDVILLETKEFIQENELELYLRELIIQRLK